jgi:ankyrin repeat protein
MPSSKLPERASLEYLRKLAKERLQELRRADPRAKLAAAQLGVAQDHGFSSWRALKAEIEQQQAQRIIAFFEACALGDVESLRRLLENEASLVRERDERSAFGSTGLHLAASGGHVNAVRLLLEHGADPNARDRGDNAYPLHFAAGAGHIEIVRALLDAGGDVHGIGDAHQSEVIGWATALVSPADIRRDVLSVLFERGARHHIFSAVAAGDREVIQKLVEDNPGALDRRMSRFEQGKTPLHFAISRQRHDIVDLLVDLGADLEAEDKNGHTALASAMLHGDREAMRRLHAAGAKQPRPQDPSSFETAMAAVRNSVKAQLTPMLRVADVEATAAWYTSIGFQLIARNPADRNREMDWAKLAFGKSVLMLTLGGSSGDQQASLWFATDRIDDLYRLLKDRQLGVTQTEVRFGNDLYEPFYGGRELSIIDPNGFSLNFHSC